MLKEQISEMPTWRNKLNRLLAVRNLYANDPKSIAIFIATAAIGCLDRYLQQQRTKEVVNLFLKHAHGDITNASRHQFKEVYDEFDQWLRSRSQQ